MFDDRRPENRGADVQELRKGPGFGFEPLSPAFGLRERLADEVEPLACGGMCRFRAQGVGFRLRP